MHEDAHPGADEPYADAFEAARLGDAERVRAALESGLAVDARNRAGDSLLMLAAYHGHEPVVELLIARGADPNALNARGQHPLAGVCYKGHSGIARRLLEAGADVDGAPGAARSPLMYAAMYNHAEVTRLLIAHGAHAGLQDRNGKCALDLAREMRAVHTIGLLTGDRGG